MVTATPYPLGVAATCLNSCPRGLLELPVLVARAQESGPGWAKQARSPAVEDVFGLPGPKTPRNWQNSSTKFF